MLPAGHVVVCPGQEFVCDPDAEKVKGGHVEVCALAVGVHGDEMYWPAAAVKQARQVGFSDVGFEA